MGQTECVDVGTHPADSNARRICSRIDKPANLRRHIDRLGFVGQPRPPTRLVGRDEQRTRVTVHCRAEVAHEPLQAGQLVVACLVIRIPHGQRDVVPPQRVADGRDCRVDVDRTTGEHLPNAQRAHTVLALQPPFAFLLVHRDTVLREAPCVLERGGRRGNPLDGNVVTQRVQDRVDVPLDTGAEQLDSAGVATQLRDLLFQREPDGRADIRHALVRPSGNQGDVVV